MPLHIPIRISVSDFITVHSYGGMKEGDIEMTGPGGQYGMPARVEEKKYSLLRTDISIIQGQIDTTVSIYQTQETVSSLNKCQTEKRTLLSSLPESCTTILSAHT